MADPVLCMGNKIVKFSNRPILVDSMRKPVKLMVSLPSGSRSKFLDSARSIPDIKNAMNMLVLGKRNSKVEVLTAIGKINSLNSIVQAKVDFVMAGGLKHVSGSAQIFSGRGGFKKVIDVIPPLRLSDNAFNDLTVLSRSVSSALNIAEQNHISSLALPVLFIDRINAALLVPQMFLAIRGHVYKSVKHIVIVVPGTQKGRSFYDLFILMKSAFTELTKLAGK